MLALLHRSPFTRKLNVCLPVGRLFVPMAIGEIWQVFWLGVHFNAFPYFTVAKIKASQSPPLGGLEEAPYSYGDSAGFTPDFPFNLFRY
jgi:hypothetical protein